VYWDHLVQDWSRWWALVNMVMSLRDPFFLNGRGSVGCPRMVLLRRVTKLVS
jgi:hypothetical protein